MKKIIFSLVLVLSSFTSFVSAKDLNSVSSLTAQRSGNDIVVNWVTAPDTEATTAVLSYNNGTTQNINISENTYTILNASENENYEIKVFLKNEDAQSTAFEVTVPSVKYAFLTIASSAATIEDDDEIAAAQWFIAQYPNNGTILSTQNVASTNLNQYKVIWIHVDRIGTGAVPTELTESAVKTKLTDYYKAGGNLLLSVHATQYITDLGRMASNRKPGILGAGVGGSNDDTWNFNVNIGMVYDYTEHPIFVGLTSDMDYGHPSIPLIGAGFKEDHNCMWDLNSYGYTPGEGSNVVLSFEAENNATVLGTWGHVTDFCCAGIVSFNPTDTYKGRSIAIGLAAYEWNQNSGVNQYQSNLDQLTKNTLNYLRSEVYIGKESSLISTITDQKIDDNYFINADKIEFYKPEDIAFVKIYSVDGSLVKTNTTNAEIVNIGNLKSGAYILSYQTKDGDIFSSKFFK